MTAEMMTETESRNYSRGLDIIRMIPGLERVAAHLIELGLDAHAIDTCEGLVMFDDELRGMGWVRSPVGWVFPPKVRCEASAY